MNKYSSLPSNGHAVPLFWQAVSLWLSCAQVVLPISGGVAATAPSASDHLPAERAHFPAAPEPKVVGISPSATPPVSHPVFSNDPTDFEFFRAPILPRNLVPASKPRHVAEDRAFAQALMKFYQQRDAHNTAVLENFVHAYPDSRWKASLLLNLGRLYNQTARFSKAIEAWQESWHLTQGETERRAKMVADEAAMLLALSYVFLGRRADLQEILNVTATRDISGAIAEHLEYCRIALIQMAKRPQRSFRCGPAALANLCAAEGLQGKYDTIESDDSTANGTSLVQMWRLSERAAMGYQMARRAPGAPVLYPAMVHWKLGHYSAITKESGGRFRIEDPNFDERVWSTEATLDDEASGYFLVKQGPLPKGWSPVFDAEASLVWGKAFTVAPNPYASSKYEKRAKPCPRVPGMAQYNVHSMLASLQIIDFPLGYAPPRGPAIDFQVNYNQREATQIGDFSHSTLGFQWHFNWFAYLNVSSTNSSDDVYWYPSGGGRLDFKNDAPSSWKAQEQAHTRLVKVSSTNYQVLFSDGSKEIYDLANGTDASHRLLYMTKVIDAASNIVTLNYSANFRLREIVDAVDQTNTVAYGSEDVDDPMYYRIVTVTDPFNRSATFQYDADDRLTNITDVIGLKSTFTYGTGTNFTFITSMTTPYGTTKFSKYAMDHANDEAERWIEIEDPYGEKERVEFRDGASGFNDAISTNDVPKGMTVETNSIKWRNSFYWDKKAMREYPTDYNKARLTKFLLSSSSRSSGIVHSEKDPLGSRVWYTYPDMAGTDKAGTSDRPLMIGRIMDDTTTQTNTFQYDSFHNLTNYIDPVGRSTRFIYAANGVDLLEVRQVRAGNFDLLAKFQYNSQHLPTNYIDAAGQTNRFVYNAYGQITAFTNALTNVTTWAYDSSSRLTNITIYTNVSSPAVITSFTYDATNRVHTVTNSDGYSITYDYDALDRIRKLTYPGTTNYEEFVYTSLDLAKYRDRNGHWTRNFYNANRQIIAVEDPLGRLTKFDWCGCGSLDNITDPLGRVTSWIRDIQGRVTSKIYPDGRSVNFTYENSTDRLRSVTDAKGQSKWFAYFNDNNLKLISYTNAPGTTNVSFTYNSHYNRVVTMIDGIGGITNTYYAVTNGTLGAGQIQSIDGPFNNDVIGFEYDKVGRLIQRDINGMAVRQTFDALGRVTQFTNLLGKFTNNYVDATFRLSSVKYPNGQNTYFSYYGTTNDFRLESIWHKRTNDSATISKFGYTYDKAGQINTWAQSIEAGSSNTWIMEYDLASQLTAVTIRTNGTSGALVKRYAYAYDKAGNRTGEQIDDVPNQAVYNGVNQLTNMQSAGPTRFAGWMSETGIVTVAGTAATMTSLTNFSGSAELSLGANTVAVVAYDSQGNYASNRYQVVITSGLATTLKYDANGNLTNQYTSTYTNSYDWDGEDRLIRITRRSTNDPVEYTTEFLYDGLGRRVQIIERTNGVVESSPRYLWCETELCEKRGSGGGTPTVRYFAHGEHIGVGSLYYTRDHLGSVREMLGEAQSLRARYDFDPYGRKTKASGDLDAAFGYTGHFYHPGSTLHLAMYRALDSGAGRWLNRDPIEELGGANLYAYVNNNPINALDPTGLFTAGFAKAWIQQIHAGRDVLMSSGSGVAPILWNTAVGSFASLGEIIPDMLKLGDATGTVAGDPCATKTDWVLAGLQDFFRAASLASTIAAPAFAALKAVRLNQALAHESATLDRVAAAQDEVIEATLNYNAEWGKVRNMAQENGVTELRTLSQSEQVEAAMMKLAGATARLKLAIQSRQAASARAAALDK